MEKSILISEIIRKRRSIYPQQYTDQEIPRGIIEEILENANWAPTHKLTEPWRFQVFHGEGRATLAQFQAEMYKTNTAKFEQKKYEKLLSKPLQCSHIISIGMKKSGLVPEIEEVEAVACAVQNMYLTANAYGLGCYWGSGGVTYMEDAKSFFGLDAGDKLLGFFFLGYPKIEGVVGRRTPIADKVIWRSE